MCLIVAKNQTNASFSVEDFKTSFSKNSDGTGIIYIENGRVKVEKTMGDLKDHLGLYYKHMDKPQFILHHRMATHGTKSLLNVHPFQVLSIDEGDPYDLFMAHNGIISMNKFSATADKDYSDTNLFVQEYLTPLMRQYPAIIEHEVFQMMLHDFIGSNNKLAFLRSDGRMFIFNKDNGAEHNGCWLSNKHSIENYKAATTYATKHGAHHTGYGNYGNSYGDYDAEDYAETGNSYQKNWNQANNLKNKSKELRTNCSIDDLLDSINTYSGMAEGALEDLVIGDPDLVLDMIHLLETGKPTPNLENEKANIIAAKLYDLLQDFSKKKAA